MPTTDEVVERHVSRDRGITTAILSVALGISVLITLMLAGITLGEQDARRETRVDLGRALVSQAFRHTCDEIERLKAGERAAARQTFDDLDKNLKLLGLKRTPAIVRAARQSRDRKLERYAKTACPIPF